MLEGVFSTEHYLPHPVFCHLSQHLVVVWITFLLGHSILPSESLAEMIFRLFHMAREQVPLHCNCHFFSLSPLFLRKQFASHRGDSQLWQLNSLMCQNNPHLEELRRSGWPKAESPFPCSCSISGWFQKLAFWNLKEMRAWDWLSLFNHWTPTSPLRGLFCHLFSSLPNRPFSKASSRCLPRLSSLLVLCKKKTKGVVSSGAGGGINLISQTDCLWVPLAVIGLVEGGSPYLERPDLLNALVPHPSVNLYLPLATYNTEIFVPIKINEN